MSSQQSLHNPKSVYFLGASFSKAVALSTAIIYVVAEMKGWHDAMVFDTTKIFDHAQFYRIFVCNLTFGSMGELLFGLAGLCPLMRRFEREMGTRKFGTYTLYTTILSIFLELILYNIFYDTERYSGPYPLLGAMLYLFHTYTPRMHPKFFGVLGFDFSEKALTYGLCAQVIFSGGLATVLPTILGFVAGMACVGLSQNELPDCVYATAGVLGKMIADEAPAVMMARSVQRAGRSRRGTGGQRGGGGATRTATAQQAVRRPSPPPPLPPPEEAIEQLTSMGFEREAVVRALQASGNNVEAAANRLLTG